MTASHTDLWLLHFGLGLSLVEQPLNRAQRFPLGLYVLSMLLCQRAQVNSEIRVLRLPGGAVQDVNARQAGPQVLPLRAERPVERRRGVGASRCAGVSCSSSCSSSSDDSRSRAAGVPNRLSLWGVDQSSSASATDRGAILSGECTGVTAGEGGCRFTAHARLCTPARSSTFDGLLLRGGLLATAGRGPM